MNTQPPEHLEVAAGIGALLMFTVGVLFIAWEVSNGAF